MLTDLVARIDADIQRLEKEDTAAAIASLELERQTLRHRERRRCGMVREGGTSKTVT